jgi:hypothetical protein
MIDLPPRHVVPHRTRSVLECELPEELLLHVPGGEMAIALNVSARAVWELCDGHRSLEKIALTLCERFQAVPDEVLAGVQDAVRQLVRLDVLRLPRDAGAASSTP